MDLSRLALPLLHRFDPERAHGLTIWGLRHGFGPAAREPEYPVLACRVWGKSFPNPIGIPAGFDKNAEAFAPLLRAGFGFVEVGTVTPRPQTGNPKPRVFRLVEDAALINRLGFNNEGIESVAARLTAARPGIVGVNIGKNKDTKDPAADYVAAARRLALLADYLVINVSSPNTPGLRMLQAKAELTDLVQQVRGAMREAASEVPLLVKVAPDMTEEDASDVAEVVHETALDGLIVSNTTVARPDTLVGRYRRETGGLSGRPLFDPSTRLLARFYRLTEGGTPLIGVGGVASGADAYAKIRAGASLVQLYTALTYRGPVLLQAIKKDLAALLHRDGFATVAEAIGADRR